MPNAARPMKRSRTGASPPRSLPPMQPCQDLDTAPAMLREKSARGRDFSAVLPDSLGLGAKKSALGANSFALGVELFRLGADFPAWGRGKSARHLQPLRPPSGYGKGSPEAVASGEPLCGCRARCAGRYAVAYFTVITRYLLTLQNFWGLVMRSVYWPDMSLSSV